MKSIFRRYCLTHTYLSPYVKTSNEDKYKRTSGIACLIGVLMLICALPARADDFVIDIRQSWTETESCLPLVELECPQIVGFLREYIFPIYRNNNGDKDYDRIYLIITEEDNCAQIRLLLYLHDKGELTGDSVFWKGYRYSVAIIDDIRVIVISEKTCPYIKSQGDRTVCFKAIKDLHANNDACAEWGFELRNNDLVFTYFLDWGISWLKKLKRETYDPRGSSY